MRSRTAKLAAVATVAALALLWLVLNRTAFLPLDDPQQVNDWVMQWESHAPLAIILLQAAQVVLAPIPGQGLGAASGYLFGTWWGAIYSLTGTIIGSFIAIVLARRYGRPLVERWVSESALAWVDARASQRGLLFFALVFLLPFLPDDVACLIAGLSAIPIPALMLAVLAGRTPGVFAAVWIGANAANLGTAQLLLVVAAGGAVALLFLRFEGQLQSAAMDLVERLLH